MNNVCRVLFAFCLLLILASIGFCVETEGSYPDHVIGDVEEAEGTPISEAREPRDTVRVLRLPAASFSNTFEMSNQQPGRAVFRPSAGYFIADRATGAYAKAGFQLESSGLKIINVRLHARDNSGQNALVQVFGLDLGAGPIDVATFGSRGSSTQVLAYDFSTDHVYQGGRYYFVSIWVPDSNCDVYGIEIWYEESKTK